MSSDGDETSGWHNGSSWIPMCPKQRDRRYLVVDSRKKRVPFFTAFQKTHIRDTTENTQPCIFAVHATLVSINCKYNFVMRKLWGQQNVLEELVRLIDFCRSPQPNCLLDARSSIHHTSRRYVHFRFVHTKLRHCERRKNDS